MKAKITILLLLCVGIAAVIYASKSEDDPRQPIVFWGSKDQADEIFGVVRRFERENPQYRVIVTTAAARDFTGDAQRLLTAVAGGVPPDLVWFDRFAIGEWASRGALTNLRPLLEAQRPDDPNRIELTDLYPWALAEASYAPPGSNQEPGVFGIPTGADVRAMFVATDALRQAGLVDERGEPRLPRTWDELRDYAVKLTIYRVPGDRRSGIVRLGFAPNVGNAWLYLYAFQAGAELMNPDRTRVTLSAPGVVRALTYMTSVYDALGGVAQVSAFQDAQGAGDLDPFIRGRLVMKIDGDWYMDQIADWRPNMEFRVVPAPMPADELDRGKPPVAWAGGFSYVIPSTALNREGAFSFMQFLASERGIRMLEAGRRERKRSEGRLYLPHGLANRKVYESLLAEYVDADPTLPPSIKTAYETFRTLMPNTKFRPVTPIGQLLWNQHVRATDAAVNHAPWVVEESQRTGKPEAAVALERMQVEAQAALERAILPPPPTVVNWSPYLWAYAALIFVPPAAIWVAYSRRRVEYGYRARDVGAAVMFITPWVIGMIVFVGGPILFSIVFSFTRYDVLTPARYVGLGNYREVFSDPLFYKSLGNTAFMVLGIPLGMAVSLGIAMLLNHAIRGMGLYRAAFYLPVVMPLVATSLLWQWLLNPTSGQINLMIGWLIDTAPARWIESLISLITSSPFHFSTPLWLGDATWSKPSIILMGLWKAGGGMIIWLAGLQSIPNELYEAASIDGAGPWKRFRHVTLPMLSPFILFNLIIGLIGTMQIFSEAYIMTAGGPVDSTLFYAYHLFKEAFQFFRMGYASAMAWILFIIVLVLTLLQLWLSRKWVHYERT